MKRMLLVSALAFAISAPAFAADLPLPPATVTYVPAAPPFSWSGFYLGLNAGYGVGWSKWSSPLGAMGSFATNGAIGGGTIGANYQWGQAVFGVEGDIDWQNLRGASTTGPCSGAVGLVGSCATASNWISTVRGRVGVALDHLLLYGTGGGAFTNVKPSTAALPYGGGAVAGWTAGVGMEYASTDNWTIKAEYLFADFQHVSCNVGSCGLAAPATVSFTENMIRLGINYKFGYW